jgi:uncharacterized OB-fold protein
VSVAGAIKHPKPGMDHETRAYWEGAGRHELVLQRCLACGAVQHRPRALCAGCLSDRVQSFVASGRGTVHTYTVTHQNQAPGFREALPYVLAYVDLEEGPRLLTNVVGCEPGSVRIGMPVAVEFADMDEIAVPRFRPA